MPGLRSVAWSTAALLKVSTYSNLSQEWKLNLSIRKSSVFSWLGCSWVAFRVKVFWSKSGRQHTEYLSWKNKWVSLGSWKSSRLNILWLQTLRQDPSRKPGSEQGVWCPEVPTTRGRACGVPPLSAQQQMALGAEETLWQTLSHQP